MGDFYVDDGFYDHPKALRAGEDASNLFVRILAWAHRNNTGHIPKGALPSLTQKRNVTALAKNLCEAGLLHDAGPDYEIHDWYVRNAKSLARREAGKKGAEAKWKKYYEEQQAKGAEPDDPLWQNSAIAEPSQDGNGDLPMPNQPRNQGTKEPPKPPADALLEAWLSKCMGKPPEERNVRDVVEGKQVLDHLRRYVTEEFIESCMSSIVRRGTKVRTARYLLTSVIGSAANRGETIPPMTLATMQAVPEPTQEAS